MRVRGRLIPRGKVIHRLIRPGKNRAGRGARAWGGIGRGEGLGVGRGVGSGA